MGMRRNWMRWKRLVFLVRIQAVALSGLEAVV